MPAQQIPLSLPAGGTFDERGNFVFSTPEAKLSFLLNAFTPPQAPQPKTGFWSSILPQLLSQGIQTTGQVLGQQRQQNLQAQQQQRQLELGVFSKLLENPALADTALAGLSAGPNANQAPGFWGGLLARPVPSPAWNSVRQTVAAQEGQPNPYLSALLGPGAGARPVGSVSLPAATTAAQPAGGASSLVQGTAPAIPGAVGPASAAPGAPPPALASPAPAASDAAFSNLFRPPEMTPEELAFTQRQQGGASGAAVGQALGSLGAPAAAATGVPRPAYPGAVSLDDLDSEIMRQIGPPPPNERGQLLQLSPRQEQWLKDYSTAKNRALEVYSREQAARAAPGFAQKAQAEQAALWVQQNLQHLVTPDPNIPNGLTLDVKRVLTEVPPEMQGYVLDYARKQGWLPNTDTWRRQEDRQAETRGLRELAASGAADRRAAAAEDAFARRASDIGVEERRILEGTLFAGPRRQAEEKLRGGQEKLLKEHPEWEGGGLAEAKPYAAALGQLKSDHARAMGMFSPQSEAQAIIGGVPPNPAGQELAPLVAQILKLPPDRRAQAAQEFYSQAVAEAGRSGTPYYSAKVLAALRVLLGLSAPTPGF